MAKLHGVTVVLNSKGGLDLSGKQQDIEKIITGIKERKKEIITFLQPVEPRLKSCPLCHGRDFIHGNLGGYFCIICQPGQQGKPVRAGGFR